MSWADSIRTTAFATLAEQTTTVRRVLSGNPPGWYPQDVWLNRAKQPRTRSRTVATAESVAPVRRPVVRKD
jgi:hypothetical protein